MNDATGMPRTAVVIGGSSDLARAVLVQLASRRLREVLLAGRDHERLAAAAKELEQAGVDRVELETLDVLDVARHEDFARRAFERLGTIDLLVVAAGSLPAGDGSPEELDAEATAESIAVNFGGPAALLVAFAKRMTTQGFGRIVVFSSVAGLRVRRANFLYGGAKAGLDGFSQGLADALAGTGVKILIVRPGFVHTKMNAGRRPPPLATRPDVVAEAVVQGLETGAGTIHVPGILGPIFGVLRLLPQSIWRHLPD